MRSPRRALAGFLLRSMLIMGTGAAQAFEPALSPDTLQDLEAASERLLNAPDERAVLESRGRLADGADAGTQQHWLRALDILADYRLKELASRTRGDNRENPADGRIDEKTLEGFVDGFVGAYDNGDLDAFMRLFDNGARANDKYGKRVIRRAYNKLFRETVSRRIVIQDMEWEHRENGARGSGHFEVEVDAGRRSAPRSYTGKLVLEVTRDWRELRISSLYYSACQLDTL